MLELVGDAGAEARPAWEKPRIAREHAIHGFHGVTIWAAQGDDTERVLVDTLGFRAVHEDGSTRRFAWATAGRERWWTCARSGASCAAPEARGRSITWRGGYPTTPRSSRCASG